MSALLLEAQGWPTALRVEEDDVPPAFPPLWVVPQRAPLELAVVHSAPDVPSRSLRERAIELLQERGFRYIGPDPVGLPCYRSPSGVLLIAVGSCRCLAYAPVDGRLQVVTASRTAALVCRITLPGGGIP
jgi:hypothetical protein